MLGVALAVFAVGSVVLGVVDVRHHRLPHALVLPALALALALLTSAAFVAGEAGRLAGIWSGAAGAFVLGLALHLARPRDFGGGDATLGALLGAHLGWFGADAVVGGLVSGFVCGGAAAAGALLAGARRTGIAFGPPLLLGTWWVLLGEVG
ncbi:MAG: hypothetical protein BGO45_04300 [Microbacterium sp. 71-36]|uniref:prepilin peptidase n=1 Tax=unclassified Microbacterium TaxID=2609290 RepID=UPI00086C6B58|nr:MULTISPECIES: prepilin peptidase [unclassified Microbacterium]MBN9212288.1 prepilin peptidase [Microbacterium sp.]ODT38647.1 MAG: hypothetical protein ABS60_09730 [Microbacterium sp. SCN 71-17]OJV75725.1 MAG: hypothetical protein BGO45_04300 [Microbacterium sp. 71-36]